MKKKTKFNAALEKLNQVPWKTATCAEGKKCWCRCILPKDKILFDKSEVYIIHAGVLYEIQAEHIVKLHNESLIKKGNRQIKDKQLDDSFKEYKEYEKLIRKNKV